MFSIIGGLIYRIRGGLPPKMPRPIDQVLFSLPYGYMAYLFSNDYYVCAIVLALTTLFVCGGHGQWYSLGTVWKRIEAERFDFIVKWFFGEDPRVSLDESINEERPIKYDKLYWRCVFGMAVSGVTYALLIAVCAAWFGLYTESLILFLSGTLKAPAYMLGWALPSKINHFRKGTELGEFFTGYFLWGVLGIVHIY